MISSKSEASAVIARLRSSRGNPFIQKFYRRLDCFVAALLAITLLTLPCHADPNTYLIKHQTGKNSKSILDKKFVHLNAPSQAIVNPNTNNDTKGLETLSANIQKALPVIKSKPLIVTAGKTKPLAAKDKSTWDDYAIEDSSIEDFEELDVNAKLIQRN